MKEITCKYCGKKSWGTDRRQYCNDTCRGLAYRLRKQRAQAGESLDMNQLDNDTLKTEVVKMMHTLATRAQLGDEQATNELILLDALIQKLATIQTNTAEPSKYYTMARLGAALLEGQAEKGDEEADTYLKRLTLETDESVKRIRRNINQAAAEPRKLISLAPEHPSTASNPKKSRSAK